MTAAHNDIASSRPIGVAQVLGGVALDEATVFSRPVVLTGEHTTLLTRNGQWCLLDSLRLLSRIVGPLTVVLPAGLGEFGDGHPQRRRAHRRLPTVEFHQLERLGGASVLGPDLAADG